MSRDLVQKRLFELVGKVEDLAKELESEVDLLRKTIISNREDVFGMKTVIHGLRVKANRLGEFSARLDELHSFKYRLPETPKYVSDAERREIERRTGEEEGPSSGS